MNDSLLIGILSPILLTIGGLISWYLKSKKEDLIAIEETVRLERKDAYKEVLDPFIVILSPTSTNKEKDEATKKIKSSDYRRHIYDLLILGSDSLITSYNSLMQHFYNVDLANDPDQEKLSLSLKLYSSLLLEIRKDLYNKKTKLKRSQMLEFWLKDIENYKNRINAQ